MIPSFSIYLVSKHPMRGPHNTLDYPPYTCIHAYLYMGVSLLFYFAGNLYLLWLPGAILIFFPSHHTTSELGKYSRLLFFSLLLLGASEKRFLFYSFLPIQTSYARATHSKKRTNRFPSCGLCALSADLKWVFKFRVKQAHKPSVQKFSNSVHFAHLAFVLFVYFYPFSLTV